MGIVLDIIIVLIIGLCAFLAAKKGFVLTLIELVGFIIAIVIATNVSAPLAQITYDKAIKPTVTNAIASSFESDASEALENIPDFVTSIFKEAGFDLSGITTEAGESVGEAAARITDTVVKSSVVNILKAIYTIPLFFILMIVVKLLAKLVNSLFKGVVLGGANKVLGCLLGGAKGILFAVLFSLLTFFLSAMFNDELLFFTKDAIEDSYICEYFLSVLKLKV